MGFQLTEREFVGRELAYSLRPNALDERALASKGTAGFAMELAPGRGLLIP